MKTSRTLVFSLLFVLMGLSLMLGSPRQANALSSGDWSTVAGNIDAYIGAMDTQCPNSVVSDILTCRDEEIFFSTANKVRTLLDSNGDGTLLGVGDDMSVRPVMVDNLCYLGTLIPGTTYRFGGASGTCTTATPTLNNDWFYAANTANATAVRTKVEQYYEAGFGTDIHIY